MTPDVSHAPSSPQTISDNPRRILIVDDHADTAATMSMILRSDGHDVQTAGDGIDALRKLAEFKPDLIVLDLGMPKLDGFDACGVIRSRPGGEKVMIVALSGYASPEDREQSRRAGFDHHLAKPLRIEELRGIIAGLPA